MKVEVGVMVVRDGKAWGISYEDGQITSYDWVALEDATIYDPQFCKKPEDVMYSSSMQMSELQTGRVVCVERRTEVILTPTDSQKQTQTGENHDISV